MRFFSKLLAVTIFIFIFLIALSFFTELNAAPVCGGKFYCNNIESRCLDPDGNNCQAGDPSCSRDMYCIPGSDAGHSCGGSICPSPEGLCHPLCGMASYSCTRINDPCTVGSQCGANSRCCAGFLCGKAVSEVGVMVLSFKEYTLINI